METDATLPPPAWTAAPTVTGAYWFQLAGAKPDICWIHNDMAWFAPAFSSDFESASVLGSGYGSCFWGPIPWPSEPQPGLIEGGE